MVTRLEVYISRSGKEKDELLQRLQSHQSVNRVILAPAMKGESLTPNLALFGVRIRRPKVETRTGKAGGASGGIG